jgi:pimeloyl-ACP methyl ester carboxylesterase
MFPYDARFVPVPGGQLAVTDVGEGPPVLLVHGTPTWSVDWRHLIPALSASHRVIAPDHLGFGRSTDCVAGVDLMEGESACAHRSQSHAVITCVMFH